MRRLAPSALLLCACLDFGDLLDRCRNGEGACAPDGAADGGGHTPSDAGLCFNAFCWENPLPQGNEILALAGTPPDDVWAGGWANMLMHWNGVRWTSHQELVPPARADNDVRITSFWSDDAGVRLAGGYLDGPYELAQGGWRTSDAPQAPILGLAGDSLTDLWGTSTSGLLKHRVGAMWQDVNTPSMELGGPIDVDGNTVTAGFGTQVVRCDATSCMGTSHEIFDAGMVIGLSRRSGPLTVELGNGETWEELADGGFTRVASGAGFGVAYAFSLLADGGGLLAADSNGPRRLNRRDGGWDAMPIDVQLGSYFAILAAPGLTGSWAAGRAGQLAQLEANGSWAVKSGGVQGDLVAVVALADGTLVAANLRGDILSRGSRGQWAVATPSEGTTTRTLEASATGGAWVGRNDGRVERWTNGGLTDYWSAPGGRSILALHELPTGLLVTTAGGKIYRLTGGAPDVTLDYDGGEDVYDLDGWDDGNLWFAGADGKVGRRSFDGGWSLSTLAASRSMVGIWAHPDAGVFACGYGEVWHLGANGNWQPDLIPMIGNGGEAFNAIGGTSVTNLWIAASWGRLFKWNGIRWEHGPETGTRADFAALLVRGQELWLAGQDGTILHYTY